jgi:HD-like signal output (HDOD) protein
MENNLTAILQKLSQPIQLPSLAKNIHVLMQSLTNDNLGYQQLAEVLKHYPEITARLLFLANSSWSAPISPITSIEQACSRLGTSIVKSISIAISIASSFDTRRCPFFNTVHFWTTSMLVAEGAGLLASKLPSPLASTELEQSAQTAGVLHNLGVLWLADNLPVETDKALQMMADESSSLTFRDSLRQCIGTDYCEIGGKLAKQLKLPEVLSVAMEHHLNPDYQESSWEMALLTGEAAKMASALLHKQTEVIPSNSRLEKLGIDSATQKLIFQQLSKNFDKTHQLAKTLFEG